MNNLQRIADSINNLTDDIKAEVIAAEIIDNGLSPAEVVIIPDGSFRRKYSKDIARSEVIKSENGQNVIGIHVTRDGLYDSLPEAVFHDQSTEPLTSGHEMAKFSKKQKIEEKEARLFLLPFENEIFHQRIQVEIEERKILRRFSENIFDDIYPQFWKLDKTLPKKLLSRLVLILHLANQIVGRVELTAKCLEIILEESVKINLITQKPLKQQQIVTTNKKKTGLGNFTLGNNMICGEYVSDSDQIMEFVIGPLNNSSIEDYLENGPYARFLSCFYNYFIPLEMDAVTTINVSIAQQQFILDDNGANVILGFNSGI